MPEDTRTDTRTDKEIAAVYAHDPIVLSVRLTSTCPHGKPSNTCCGNAEWMRVIHAVNREHDDSFGAPVAMYNWWAGGWCEEYPQYRVILRTDSTTNIQAKTDGAAEYLKRGVLAVCGHEIDSNGVFL